MCLHCFARWGNIRTCLFSSYHSYCICYTPWPVLSQWHFLHWSCYIFKAYYLCNTDTLLVSINMIVTNVQLHCLAFQSSKPKRTGRLIMRPFLVLGNRSFSGPAVGRVVSSSCTQLPSSCFGVVTLILLSFFKKVWLNISSASSFMSMMVLLVTGDEVFNWLYNCCKSNASASVSGCPCHWFFECLKKDIHVRMSISLCHQSCLPQINTLKAVMTEVSFS